jgi:hypothetical protein
MPGFPATEAFVEALGLLCTALGLSTASGLRAYLPVLAVAVGSHVPTPHGGHLVRLTPAFHVLGSPVVIGVVAALALAELVIDAVPVLVHLSDLLHTVVRPVAGAVVMAGTVNALSDRSLWLAGAVGAALALAVHIAKAATRPAVTAATAGVANPAVSLAEDVVALLLVGLALVASLLLLIVLPLLALATGVLLAHGLLWYRRRRRARLALDRPA